MILAIILVAVWASYDNYKHWKIQKENMKSGKKIVYHGEYLTIYDGDIIKFHHKY